MDAIDKPVSKRRPHNQLKSAMRDYLRTVEGMTASISEIRSGTADIVGEAPQSSYRSALQDERYFTRVSRGVFRLKEENVTE